MCSNIGIVKIEFQQNLWHFCHFGGLGTVAFAALIAFLSLFFFFYVGEWNQKTQAAPSWTPRALVNTDLHWCHCISNNTFSGERVWWCISKKGTCTSQVSGSTFLPHLQFPSGLLQWNKIRTEVRAEQTEKEPRVCTGDMNILLLREWGLLETSPQRWKSGRMSPSCGSTEKPECFLPDVEFSFFSLPPTLS